MERFLLKDKEAYDKFMLRLSNTWPKEKYPPKSYPAVILFKLSDEEDLGTDYLTYDYVYPEDFSD